MLKRNSALINAGLMAILVTALIHCIIMLVIAVKERDIRHLNYFRILNLDYFFPGIDEGRTSQLTSAAVIIGLVAFFYFK